MDAQAGDNAGFALPEGYASFYDAYIGPELAALEGERKRITRLGKICLVIGLAGLAATVFGAAMLGMVPAIIGFVLMCGSIVALAIPANRLSKKVKRVLVEPTCRFLGYEYQVSGAEFPLARFTDNRLIDSRKGSTTRVEDYIRGKRAGVAFEMCEAKITRKSSSEDSSSVTVFRGLLFKCRFPRRFTGATWVMSPSRRGKAPGKDPDGASVERVHLETSKFSSLYSTYSSDQVEARYLLTPGFMERMVTLAVYFFMRETSAPGDDATTAPEEAIRRSRLSVAFIGDELLLAIDDRENRFEGGSVFKAIPGRKRAEQLIRELTLVTEIIDTLDLDSGRKTE